MDVAAHTGPPCQPGTMAQLSFSWASTRPPLLDRSEAPLARIRTSSPQADSDTPDNPASPEDHARFRALVESHQWHFAKSMAATPHSYTRRREWASGDWGDGSPGDLDFVWAARFVQTHGVPRRFYQSTYLYYDLGEHQYWTMGADPGETEIINRADKETRYA